MDADHCRTEGCRKGRHSADRVVLYSKAWQDGIIPPNTPGVLNTEIARSRPAPKGPPPAQKPAFPRPPTTRPPGDSGSPGEATPKRAPRSRSRPKRGDRSSSAHQNAAPPARRTAAGTNKAAQESDGYTYTYESTTPVPKQTGTLGSAAQQLEATQAALQNSLEGKCSSALLDALQAEVAAKQKVVDDLKKSTPPSPNVLRGKIRLQTDNHARVLKDLAKAKESVAELQLQADAGAQAIHARPHTLARRS